MEKMESKFQDHIGFSVYDPVSKKTVFNYQSANYFTPGSNTKIFTFYASLKILGDSIPALRYTFSGDSLIFWGTGDPSLLYRYTQSNDRALNFLKSNASSYKLVFSPENFKIDHYGSGWAWDDYSDYYAVERSPLPLYGNIVSVSKRGAIIQITPSFFQHHVSAGDFRKNNTVVRDLTSNMFVYHQGLVPTRKVFDVPMRVTPELTKMLLEDTLKHTVIMTDIPVRKSTQYIYSIPSDSLYQVMMQESDNFIAEQLLLLCSNMLSDTLKPEIAIDYVKEHFLVDLKDKPIWVDGSGLSRYNLFTPRSVVQLWEKIYQEVSQERLFALLATGGAKNGTLKNYFKSDQPYVFGKTGSLSNNHCLSGFLVTKKGKTLIFSFMNSNFIKPVAEVRLEMERILKDLYERY